MGSVLIPRAKGRKARQERGTSSTRGFPFFDRGDPGWIPCCTGKGAQLLKKWTGFPDMWHERIGSFLPNRWKFQWRYWLRQTPWDTQVTPPEVMEFIARTPPGKALDLGCGTGTNAITLARHGWRVTGVDFIPKAILAARAKAARSGFSIDFLVASVADLSALSGPFD